MKPGKIQSPGASKTSQEGGASIRPARRLILPPSMRRSARASPETGSITRPFFISSFDIFYGDRGNFRGAFKSYQARGEGPVGLLVGDQLQSGYQKQSGPGKLQGAAVEKDIGGLGGHGQRSEERR